MTAAEPSHIAVVGALAYDQICTTESSLLDNRTALLNCKLSDITHAFGGCGGNIAYNCAQLKQPTTLVSCTGLVDDADYLAHLAALGIDTRFCLRTPGRSNARAVIMTDPEGHQFTGFYPGPVPDVEQWRAHLETISFAQAAIFIQAPYPPPLMACTLQHASQLAHPPLILFVPGQYTDQLSADQMATMVTMADWVIGNDYEIKCLQNHHSLNNQLVIRTHGAQPIRLSFADGTEISIDVPASASSVDPTGCGDALVAGLCQHLVTQGLEVEVLKNLKHAPHPNQLEALKDAVLAGCHMAAACLVQHGSQQHTSALP